MRSASWRTIPALTWLILLAALLLRIGLVSWKFPELSDDRDAYLGIAAGLWQGEGFCSPGSSVPTAFRPPLYPLLLAVVIGLGGAFGLAALQVLAGLFTVWGTWFLAKKWGLGRWANLAALCVACDPILLRYTSLPMTEVLFTALVVALLICWDAADRQGTFWSIFLTGALFGVTALCRPTLWPMFGVLAVIRVCWLFLSSQTSERFWFFSRQWVGIALVAFLVVLPWGLRNWAVLGTFKLTTTHGGYTVLLGNNPVFYQAVVRQPWGTTWGDYPPDHPWSQAVWYEDLQQKLDAQNLQSEVARDSAQYRWAQQAMRENPRDFLQSCLLRQLRLWNPIPQGPEAEGISVVLKAALICYYIGMYGLAGWGLWRCWQNRREEFFWQPAFAILLTISAVHLLYWSNARMRAPLMPIVALLAAKAFMKPGRNSAATEMAGKEHPASEVPSSF